jgi:hypothetical protein
LHEYGCALANCGFAASKLAGLGCIAGEGQRNQSPKNQLSEANYLAGVIQQSWAMLQ